MVLKLRLNNALMVAVALLSGTTLQSRIANVSRTNLFNMLIPVRPACRLIGVCNPLGDDLALKMHQSVRG